MKLRNTISWLMGTLQTNLFPKLEESWNGDLTEKEKQLVAVLELIQVERFTPKSFNTQWMGRKLRERESIARSFVAKSVYGYLFTRSLIEALRTTPSLRRICGFEKVSDITSESWQYLLTGCLNWGPDLQKCVIVVYQGYICAQRVGKYRTTQ